MLPRLFLFLIVEVKLQLILQFPDHRILLCHHQELVFLRKCFFGWFMFNRIVGDLHRKIQELVGKCFLQMFRQNSFFLFNKFMFKIIVGDHFETMNPKEYSSCASSKLCTAGFLFSFKVLV